MESPKLGQLRYLVAFLKQKDLKAPDDVQSPKQVTIPQWEKAFLSAAKIVPLVSPNPSLYWEGDQVAHAPHYRIWVRNRRNIPSAFRILWRAHSYMPLPPIMPTPFGPWLTFIMRELHAL